ncbi:MAG: hypothetical protein HY887_02710 [Deltaproteobacteria bacterium]|nr:hypothetical protein [Deltaproteobacteria bacterium]
MERPGVKKGAGIKLIGVTLSLLGGLNLMLTLKAGSGQDAFNYLFIVFGAILFGYGHYRSRKSQSDTGLY